MGRWDSKKALQLKFACDTTGYEALLDKSLPYQSIRTMQRRLQDIPLYSGILLEVFSHMKIKVMLNLVSALFICVLMLHLFLLSPT